MTTTKPSPPEARARFIRRYIQMRRERRHNARQHARCIGYVNELVTEIAHLRSAKAAAGEGT